MRTLKKEGAAKITRLTFLLVFTTLIIVVLARSCFVGAETQISTEDQAPFSIKKNITTTGEGKLNIDQERYYYDLGLLPPYELPEIYKPSTNDVISKVEDETVVSSSLEVSQTSKNEDINFFDEIELSVDLESISSKILNSDIISDVEESVSQDISVSEDSSFVEDEFDDLDWDDQDEFDDFGDFDDDFSFDDDSWDGGFADGFNTPFEPFLFEPLIQTQEEYDLFKPQETSDQELDDDFFDDFYIAGETDQSLYEDGIYYLTLFVNGDRNGDVETKFEGTLYSIGVQSLYENISDILSDYAINRIFTDAPEYYTIDELIALNVDVSIDVDAFTVSMEFDVDDIPIQYLPINKVEKNTLLNRNEQYGISDANVLTPNFFSFVSALNLSSSYTFGSSISTESFANTLSMSNSFSIGKVALDFSNSFSYTLESGSNEFEYEVDSWDGFFDIRDKNLRVSFGNTGSYLGTDGTPVGFEVEKNYTYGDDDALTHQFTRRYLLESDSTMYIYMNDEEPIIKSLRKGEYILKDFPLVQGANHVRIKIVPNDKIYPIILDSFDIPYDSRLLARGDYLYGYSAAISKSEREDDSTSWLTLPYLDGQLYDYDLSDFDTNFYLDVGISDTFTLNTSFAFGVDEIEATFDGILATMSGPFVGKLYTSYTDTYSPNVYTTLSHTIDTLIGDINASVTLQLPVWESDSGDLYSSSELGLSLSHSVSFDNLPPLSTSISASLNDSGISWSTTFSSNYSPLSGISLSSSLSISNVDYTNELSMIFQIGIGYTLLNNLTSSHSLSTSGSESLSVSYKPTNRDTLQFNISGIQFLTTTNPVYNAYWQHVDDYYSLLLKQTASDNAGSLTSSASLSSALYYSGGLFALNRSAANNFIIIRPEGDLSNNPVSIGKTNSSSLNEIDTLFGNAVYTLLSSNSKNNLIAYGTSESLYSSGGSFSYELNTSTRTGFSQRLYSPISYTVSGVLLQADGTPFDQYSSPVYKLLVDENGIEYLEPDEQLYLFTDLDGRFILSEVQPGTYLFDMALDDNQWYGLYFTVEDNPKTDKTVVLLEDYQLEVEEQSITAFDVVTGDIEEETEGTFGDTLASDYLDIIELQIAEYEDEETFWNVIFPPLDESVDDLAFEDTAADWQDSLVEEEAFDDSFFFDDPAFADTADDWESAIDDTISTVVVDNSETNPNATYVP